MARAHVLSRGGNALLGYRVDVFRMIEENRNQAYSIISLSGDAVRVGKSTAATGQTGAYTAGSHSVSPHHED